MNIAVQIAMALGSVLVLLALMALVRMLARRASLSPEVQRKLVHVGTGLYALILPWLFPSRWPVYMLIGVTLITLLVLRNARLAGGLGAALHGVERRSYGDFLLAVSIGLCFFLADGEALFYVLPITVLAFADAAAALAGTAYGTRTFQVEAGHKSIEGTAVFFIITLLIALICMMFLSTLPPANILALALMVAAFGTLVEAQSWRGFDNLFLPLGLYVLLSVHSTSTLIELLVLAAVFLLAIIGFRMIGPRLGLTNHAARVYVVATFLIFSMVEMQNAVLPVVVLLAHAWCSRRSPGADSFGDLDVVAALALFSFGWLTLGNATGWNAVQFYGLTAMGVIMGLCTLALGRRLIWLPVVAALLLGIRHVATLMNPAETLWAEPLWPLACLCLALICAVTATAPGLFARDRVLKLTFLSMVLPLGYYLIVVLNKGGILATAGAGS